MDDTRDHTLSTADEARWWARVEKLPGENACWPFRAADGSAIPDGTVATIKVAGKSMGISRVVALLYGLDLSDPEARVLRHCGDVNCVNPAHVYVGTLSERSITRTRNPRSNLGRPAGIVETKPRANKGQRRGRRVVRITAEAVARLQAFIAGTCVRETFARERAGVLYRHYAEWCAGRGVKPESAEAFKTMMLDEGMHHTSDSSGHLWYGVRFVGRATVALAAD